MTPLTPLSSGDEAELLTPWYLPESRFEELPGLVSSTDLLAAWLPDVAAPLAGSPPEAIWDNFFAEGEPAGGLAPPPVEPGSGEPWNPAAAASAADCFFRFLQALERSDVAEAMRSVAPEYHVIEDDAEIDRDALKRRLEAFLDEWRGPELRIVPTEIPDPVFFPRGILLHTTLQVDYRDRFTERLTTRLLRYLIRFDAGPGEESLIHAMCRLS